VLILGSIIRPFFHQPRESFSEMSIENSYFLLHFLDKKFPLKKVQKIDPGGFVGRKHMGSFKPELKQH
jgi:hypothetical protein